MGIFDKQLKYRQEKDKEAINDSLNVLAHSVLGIDAINEDLLSQNSSAIEAIIKYFGIKSEKKEIPESIKTSEEQMDYIMRPLGITRRKVKLDKDWYKSAIGPMIGTLKGSGNVVALIPKGFSKYILLDFVSGKKIKVNAKTKDLIENEALLFYKPLPLKELKIIDLVKFIISQLSVVDIVVYLAIMGLITLLGMLSPVFTKWLFGEVLDSGNASILISLAIFMVSYSISQALLSIYQGFVNNKVSVKIDIAVEAAVMQRILTLPAPFFKKYSSGELSERQSYVKALCSTLINSIGSTGLSAVFSLVYIGQVFAYAPSLVLPSICITIATITISLITTFKQMKISKEAMFASSKTSGVSYSMITGIQKIKLAGAEDRMFARWAGFFAKGTKYTYNPPMFLKLSGTINLAISLFGTIIIYVIAVNTGVTVSDYYAFNSAYGMASGAFTALAGIATIIANIKPILEMAKPIMETAPEIAEGKEEITSLRGDIELNNIYFRYDDSMPDVIKGLSLKINSGEYVAIVGTTGCGKSTLLRILLGFETPQKGSVFYDGKDINTIDLESLRKKIGTVMQDGKLFLADIYSNIVITAPELKMSDAWEAAKIASVDEDIKNMPMGMHTLISEGQGGISGGQKQRIMIARAVAPKPKVLMFDEATSALDNITQRKVSEAIDKLNCTRIVIAHRLSTIRHCDRIIVLDQGNIVESGTYEELIAKNGVFSELVERQRVDID